MVHNDGKDDTGFSLCFTHLYKERSLNLSSSTKATTSVDELLEVFLQLEQLNDKLLCPAVVNGRKKLEDLVQNGSAYAEVLNIITIEDDEEEVGPPSETPAGTMTNNQCRINHHHHFSYPKNK